MKRVTYIALIGLIALLLAGCSLVGGSDEPEVTYTPLPTYTPFPTWTPPPSPTPTFLPSPTPVEPTATELPVEETTEGEVDGEVAEAPPTATQGSVAPAGRTASVTYASNMRSGPGLVYEVLTRLGAGEQFTIIARDFDGYWVQIELVTGEQGWVAVRQLTGYPNVSAVPAFAGDLPDPDPTLVAELTGTPGTPDPDEEDAGTPDPDITPTAVVADTLWSMVAGEPGVCKTITYATNQPYQVSSPSVTFVPFETDRPDEVASAAAFIIERAGVPGFVNVYIDGGIKPAGCNAENICTLASMTLCASAPSSATTGAYIYDAPLRIRIGKQAYSNFYDEAYIPVPTEWQVLDE